MSLTSREVAIAILPKITGGLSMMGSGWIGYQIVSDHQKRHKTYHRLVALLSCFDFISSLCFFLSTWPIPQGENKGWKSPYHYAAVGNTATCTAQGFGIQLGITSAFLNVMLALHYLLVIRYNYTETKIAQREKYMIGIALLVGLGLSIPGLLLKIYNNSNLWCWIAPRWTLCDEQGLTRGECVQRTYTYRWAFYYGPLWTCIALIVTAQSTLWWTVRQLEVKASKWRATDSRAVRMKQSRRVAVQAAWYVAVFVVTWLPYTAVAATGRYFNPHDTTGFIVLLIVVICQPVQGFLNVFVYHRQPLGRASSRTATLIRSSIFAWLSKTGAQQSTSNENSNATSDPNTVTTNGNLKRVRKELNSSKNKRDVTSTKPDNCSSSGDDDSVYGDEENRAPRPSESYDGDEWEDNRQRQGQEQREGSMLSSSPDEQPVVDSSESESRAGDLRDIYD